jgi:aspartate/methionine/tyrosine aminotransferase
MNESKLAKRMADLGTETAFEVLARAKALEAKGREIIHLEIGEPDFDTPQNVTAAAIQALKDGYTHYGPSAGMMETREAFAGYMSRDRGADISPQQIVITPGGKPIIFYSALALLDPGDEVIYPNPGFPIYESMIKYMGAKPVPVPLQEEHGFAFAPEKLPTTFSIISPNWPTNTISLSCPTKYIRRLSTMVRTRQFTRGTVCPSVPLFWTGTPRPTL